MRYVPPILALLALFAILLALCWWGWTRRARRQAGSGLPAPAALDDVDLVERADGGGIPAVYVATTFAERHLERVTAHGLGARSRATVHPDATAGEIRGWLISREGAPDLLIPAADISTVTTAPGMVGKWIGGDGLLIVRWRLGQTLLDTGLRLARREDHDRLLALGRKEHP